jgi:hypothetical protein
MSASVLFPLHVKYASDVCGYALHLLPFVSERFIHDLWAFLVFALLCRKHPMRMVCWLKFPSRRTLEAAGVHTGNGKWLVQPRFLTLQHLTSLPTSKDSHSHSFVHGLQTSAKAGNMCAHSFAHVLGADDGTTKQLNSPLHWVCRFEKMSGCRGSAL